MCPANKKYRRSRVCVTVLPNMLFSTCYDFLYEFVGLIVFGSIQYFERCFLFWNSIGFGWVEWG